MSYLHVLAGQMDWATKNLAYNLDFIPDDKLNWKPAPTALSALEVVGHLLEVIHYFKSLTDEPGSTSASGENMTPSTRDEAKMKVIAAGEEYAHWLNSLNPEILSEIKELPFGTFPMNVIVSMPVTDAVHHHGQISYIQSLLGDSESHFDLSLFSN